jgi:hypothetical protein
MYQVKMRTVPQPHLEWPQCLNNVRALLLYDTRHYSRAPAHQTCIFFDGPVLLYNVRPNRYFDPDYVLPET